MYYSFRITKPLEFHICALHPFRSYFNGFKEFIYKLICFKWFRKENFSYTKRVIYLSPLLTRVHLQKTFFRYFRAKRVLPSLFFSISNNATRYNNTYVYSRLEKFLFSSAKYHVKFFICSQSDARLGYIFIFMLYIRY